MASRRNGWRKQKSQAASTDYSSTFSTHFGICIIRTSPKYNQPPRESVHNPSSQRPAQAAPNRYHRREEIGQRDHPGSGLRLLRPVLEGIVRGQRLGGAVTARGAPDAPEHTRATPRDSTPNPSTSATFIVCNRPRQQAHLLHLLFIPTAGAPPTLIVYPDSKHTPLFGTVFLFFQQSVRPYVAITTTQIVDVQVM